MAEEGVTDMSHKRLSFRQKSSSKLQLISRQVISLFQCIVLRRCAEAEQDFKEIEDYLPQFSTLESEKGIFSLISIFYVFSLLHTEAFVTRC